MIRISRLTDYGIVLLTHIAAHPERVHNAGEAAAEAHLPLPTVSKLLRLLAKEGLLASQRGAKGGYELARAPEAITIAEVVGSLERPIAITTCSSLAPGDCEHERLCPVRGHWNLINFAIREALESITLADLVAHPRPLLLPTLRPARAARPALPADGR